MDKIFFETAQEWGIEVHKTVEDLKFLIYRKGSHFSTWHADVGHDYSRLRRLSMSIELCDPHEYEGGELLFPNVEAHVGGAVRTAGTAVVFPSCRLHRVTPVTNGVRFAIVNWISGQSGPD
jgi:PKHD-type hydroxylase